MFVISKQFELIEMSRMHECSQVIHSTVEVLLRQMANHQYTSLCK